VANGVTIDQNRRHLFSGAPAHVLESVPRLRHGLQSFRGIRRMDASFKSGILQPS
jgi:hypothetical protein